jgi:hypothetical protein
MSQIQINAHARVNWTLEDKGSRVSVEATYNRLGDLDGFNVAAKPPFVCASDEAWISLEEAKSLRDWLNKALEA